MPTQAGHTVSRLLKDLESISLDPTYTAKTFAAVDDYCRKQRQDSGPVLYWHTCSSADLSAQADSVNYRNLPKALQMFIKEVVNVS
ncbi:MAG: hypothetical protein GY765_24365 [bacterium]|nr:hypothetical protein [bacterium]